MSDLKPCPFCGGDAYTEIYIVEAAAGCRECQFKVTREHRPYEYDGLPKVIAAWNRRALPAVQPAHVNETPKSEHVPGDVLTPATKGGA